MGVCPSIGLSFTNWANFGFIGRSTWRNIYWVPTIGEGTNDGSSVEN